MKSLRKCKVKILSFFLFNVILATMILSSCKPKDKNLDWTIKDTSNVISFDLVLEGDNTSRKLALSSEKDIFVEDINNKQFKVLGYDLHDENQKYSENVSNEITGWSVNRDSAKRLTFTLPAGKDSAHYGYSVAVHSTATIDKVFGEGWAFKTYSEELKSPEASIEGTYSTAQENPTIIVNVADTYLKENVSKEMITLGGAFSSLTIQSVSGNVGRVTILTKGMATQTNGTSGSVTLSKEATECEHDLCAKTDVVFVGAFIEEKSYRYAEANVVNYFAGSSISYNVVLVGDKFNVSLGDKIITEPFDGYVTAVSEDKTTVTIATPIKAANIDDAISEISGQNITIPAQAVESNQAKSVTLTATEATIGMDIDYIEETEDIKVVKAFATLYAINGHIEAIDTTSLSFSGDFIGVNVLNIEKDGESYKITFTFTPEYLDLDNAEYDGAVSLKDGVLLNVWESASNSTSVDIYYLGVDNRFVGEVEFIMKFIEDNQDTIEKIGSIGSVVGNVSSAASGIKTILEICNVIESTDKKISDIRRQVECVQSNITELSNQLASQTQLINSTASKAISQNNKILYNTAAANWNSFITNYQKPMSDAITDYKVAYNQFMLSFINDPTSFEIPVYINSENKVTVPGQMTGYDANGIKLLSSDNYVLDAPLEKEKLKVVNNGGRLYKNYMSDILYDISYRESFSEFRKIGQASYEAVRDKLAGSNPLPVDIYNNFVWMGVKCSERTFYNTAKLYSFGGYIGNISDSTWEEIHEICKKGQYCYADDAKAYVYSSSTYSWVVNVYETNIANPVCVGTATTEITADQFADALEMAAAMYALNKVGAEKIARTYVNFANALAGTYDSVKLSSTATPLTSFYEMESYFYNFYSESKNDISIIRSWIETELSQGHLIAVLAHRYCSGLSTDYISKASTAANNEIKSNTGVITESANKKYSYVVGDEIYAQPTSVWGDTKYQRISFSIPREINTYEDRIFEPDNSLSVSQIELMNERYKMLYKKGTTMAKSFNEYLISNGILTNDMKAAYIVGDYESSTIPKNNTVKATIVSKSSVSDWYNVGDIITIGTNGKVSSEYFSDCYQLKGTAFNLEKGKLEQVTYEIYGDYFESHFYWGLGFDWEMYDFEDSLNSLVFILIG